MLKKQGIVIDWECMTELFEKMDKPEHRPASSPITSGELRDHLNSMSDELFRQSRAELDEGYGDYVIVIMGAVLMRAGIKIADNHRNFLRQAAGGTESHPGYRLPFGDMDFRDPGKVQFLAAVGHYEDGKPRDFRGPRSVSS